MSKHYRLGISAPDRFKYLRATIDPPLSQDEFSEKFKVARATVNRIETGKHGTIKKETVEKIAQFYGVEVGWLIGETEEKISLPKPLRSYSYNNTTEQGRTLNVGVGFPDRLRAARKRAGMTQAELGEAAGLAEMTVLRNENGKVLPVKETFDQFVKVLGCDALFLYGDPGEEKLKDRLKTEEPHVPLGRVRKKREAAEQEAKKKGR